MISKLKQQVQNIDLFSKQFVFLVGSKKKKSTLLGGALSLAILIVSAAYFYYMINMYFSRGFQPKISTINTINDTRQEIQIDEDSIFFEVIVNGEPLKQLEKRLGKTFLTYHLYYDEFNEQGNLVRTSIPYDNCQNKQFSGFLCPSKAAIEGKNIFIEAVNLTNGNFILVITQCDKNIVSNCASDNEIYSIAFNVQSYLQVYMKIKQYNSQTRKFEISYRSEYTYMDPNILIFGRLSLYKATTRVTEGMLIQSSQTTDSLFDFKRIDSIFTRDDIFTRMQVDGLVLIFFEMNQVQSSIEIQYPMITEVLAQFMSIFNSMLFIGILAKVIAETKIAEEISNILLKEYYKKSALSLLKSKGKPKSQGREGQVEKVTQSIQKNESNKTELDRIIDQQKNLNDVDFVEEKKTYFKMNFFNKIKLFLSQIFLNHPKISNKDNDKGLVVFQHLLTQSVNHLNILEIYKDLIRLKMAVKLILTKEQYSAISYCGSEIPLGDQESLKNSCISSDTPNKQSYEIPEKEISEIQLPEQIDEKYQHEQQQQMMNQMTISDLIQRRQSKRLENNHEKSLMSSIDKKENNIDEKQSFMDTNNQKIIQKIKQPYPLNKCHQKTAGKHKSPKLSSIISQKEEKINYAICTNLAMPSSDLHDFTLNAAQHNQNTQKYPQKDIIQEENKVKIQQQPMISFSKKLIEYLHSKEIIMEVASDQNEEQKEVGNVSSERNKSYEKKEIFKDKSICRDERRDVVISNKEIFSEISVFPIKSHLYQMDLIDENPKEKEKYLKRFLENYKRFVREKQYEKISHIDRNIYSSLVIDSLHCLDIKHESEIIIDQSVTNNYFLIQSPKSQQECNSINISPNNNNNSLYFQSNSKMIQMQKEGHA